MENNQNPVISIVVAVYNAEKYISRCLDSILNQTFEDFEVICVNDGSLDKSKKIIHDYVQQDRRIVYIEQENKGVSVTRQVGLNHAKGTYIIHADPDDWVEPEWLEKLYRKALEHNYDVVMCDITRVYMDHKEVFRQCPRSLSQNDLIEDLIIGRIWGSCCNKLVKKSLIEKYHVEFVPSMNLWEDLYFICALFSHPVDYSYVGEALYNYDCFTNENSIVRHRNARHVQSGMTFINTFEKIFSSSQYNAGWYRRKTMVKRWVFNLNEKDYNIKNVYPEINKQFIVELNKSSFGTEDYCMALCLKGFPRIGQFLFYMMSKVYRLISQ